MANEKRLIDANELRQTTESKIYWSAIYDGLDMLEAIDDAPTVDAVEVVHGRWLYDSCTEKYFCSACNENALSATTQEPVYDYDWEENLEYSHMETIVQELLTDYCPNCGAKMDGDGDA